MIALVHVTKLSIALYISESIIYTYECINIDISLLSYILPVSLFQVLPLRRDNLQSSYGFIAHPVPACESQCVSDV